MTSNYDFTIYDPSRFNDIPITGATPVPPAANGIFRINAKHLFVTWPNVTDETVDTDKILSGLSSTIKRIGFEAVVSRELHQNGIQHFHAYIYATGNSKFNIKSQTFLDPVIRHHPNIQPARFPLSVYKYVIKGGVYRSTPNFQQPNSNRRMGTNDPEPFGELLSQKSFTDAEQYAKDNLPEVYIKNFNSLNNCLIHVYGTPVNKPYVPHASLNKRFVLPETVNQWIEGYFDPLDMPRRKVLILYGKTQLGKTAWARSLGKHVFIRGSYSMDLLAHPTANEARYLVIDDIIDIMTIFNMKTLLTSAGDFETSDKYRAKKSITWSKPVILLANENPLEQLRRMNWQANELAMYYEDNSIVVEIRDKMWDEDQLATPPASP